MAALTVGIVGMVLVLIAYTLNQLGRLDEGHVVYDGLNFIGALLLLAYAFSIKGWPFFMLNAVWGAVAGYDLYRRFRPKAKPVAAEAKQVGPAEERQKEKAKPSKELPADEDAELTEPKP